MSAYPIAKPQGITPRWVRKLYKYHLKAGENPYPKRLGKLLDSEGDYIPHNRIHKILRKKGLAKNEPKKQKRREMVRY